jgi:hypothetical protein
LSDLGLVGRIILKGIINWVCKYGLIQLTAQDPVVGSCEHSS